MKKYPDQLSILYLDRMEGLSSDIYPEEYQEELQKFSDICKEIRAILPKEKDHLFRDLDSAHGSLTAITEETGYKLGFGDALRLSATAFAGEM